MRTVIYTHDMEPITVVDIQPLALNLLSTKGKAMIEMPRPGGKIEPLTLTAETVERQGKLHMLVFTEQESLAMLLPCTFLSGQTKSLSDARNNAFTNGIIHAFNYMRNKK
jgi:hypothetical protein